MWNECIKILENGKKLPVFKESHSKPFYHYMMSLGGQSVQNVWYDTVCDVCFGEDRTFHNSPGDFVFFSAQGEFINDPMWGDFRLQNTLGIPLGNERLVTDEFIHSYHPHFSRYKDKNILIVGAGPSTLDVDWEGLDLDFDYVWTCNSFFLNDRVLKQPIDLVALSLIHI